MPEQIRKGQKLQLTYENKQFEVIVIDPNGLRKNQPSIGFGFQMFENASKFPQSTLSDWATEIEGCSILKAPSGKTFRATEIKADDNNVLIVLEAR